MLAGNLDPACFKEIARACLALVLFLLLLNYIGSINMSGQEVSSILGVTGWLWE